MLDVDEYWMDDDRSISESDWVYQQFLEVMKDVDHDVFMFVQNYFDFVAYANDLKYNCSNE